MFSGFKQFILKGNVIDLAIGVVMGVAFNTIVNSLVKGIISPFIAILIGKPNFSSFFLTYRHNSFLIGDLINSILTFLINAAVIYFLIVIPIIRISSKIKNKPEETSTKKCPFCLSTIPQGAKRCAYCTSTLLKTK